MKRAWPILAAVLVLALTGCGSNESGTTSGTTASGSQGKKPVIALVMKSLANEFFQTMQKGAEAHQKAHSDQYELISNGIKDESDVSKQQELVEQMISQGVSAIVIAPADSKALIPVCEKAVKTGIPVVNIDNKFDADVLKDRGLQIPFVGPDNRKGAKLVGDALAKKLKPGDAVAIIEGAPNAFNGIQRTLGFQDAMKAGGMKVVDSQTGNWDTEKANQVAAAMITSHPDLKALLCANDNMALGAIAALKAAGKQNSVIVVGFDNISAVHDLIQQGQVLATADQHADQLAVYGIQYALDILGKKSQPVDKETQVDLIVKTP
ncbi:MAG TPA: sugar ABC transporter substrate-binding protein [Fimbriimonadaceae bacterium]|nr:sugar ABC transporter substrate-binding protein [Fimbriimonadaceae bacterium]